MEKFPDLNKYQNIHFIGIGGVSMSSLAMLLKGNGKNVTGSDSTESKNTKALKDFGIPVFIGQKAENVGNADLIVYTAAISDNNPEMVYAKENNIPIIERAVLLGMLMLTYKHSVAVSGTHGKTTTTSMLSSIMLNGNYDPTILVGAHFKQINSNYKIGNSDYSVYEACEYVNSFHHFYPEVAIILNIDSDHLDFFKDLDAIKESFLKFTKNIENGYIVINGDDQNCEYIIKNASSPVITYGLNNSNDCFAYNIRFESGLPVFDVNYKGKIIKDIKLSVFGEHNIYNALATISVSMLYSFDETAIKNGLINFKGADRRFELKKTYNSAAIVDDYAHHPTEIKATICSAKSANFTKTTVIFQPHTYTRTKFLLDDFALELSKADQVILTDIFSAREINTVGANILDLRDKIPGSIYISSFEDIANYIKANAKPNELYILMGAGNINSIADMI